MKIHCLHYQVHFRSEKRLFGVNYKTRRHWTYQRLQKSSFKHVISHVQFVSSAESGRSHVNGIPQIEITSKQNSIIENCFIYYFYAILARSEGQPVGRGQSGTSHHYSRSLSSGIRWRWEKYKRRIQVGRITGILWFSTPVEFSDSLSEIEYQFLNFCVDDSVGWHLRANFLHRYNENSTKTYFLVFQRARASLGPIVGLRFIAQIIS